jgi:hypothetical protein
MNDLHRLPRWVAAAWFAYRVDWMALSGDMTGQASVTDGDTLEIHGTRIRLWASTRRKAVSYVAVTTACSIDAARKPRNDLDAFIGRRLVRPVRRFALDR